MFQRLPEADSAARVAFTLDGRPVEARVGDSVAAALLASGRSDCRTTPVSGAARGPFCLMGTCFECLVTIDGLGNRQACQVVVREGMQVQTQRGKREVGR